MGFNYPQSSHSGTAIIHTPYADNSIVCGCGFIFEKNLDIASAASLYVLFDYSTYVPAAGKKGIIHVLPPVFGTTAGAVIVNVFRGTNYTGGTEIDIINPNTTATKTTSGTTLTYGATGSEKGTEVLNYLVGATATNQNSGGGSSTGVSFFIRPNTGKTLVEIVNESGENITFHYGQAMFEI